MARMIPASLEHQPPWVEEGLAPTPGEKTVHTLLRDHLKPDYDYTGWYEVPIGSAAGRARPDFVLLDRHNGLFVIEVKDWDENEIRKLDKGTAYLSFNGQHKTTNNPELQAQRYVRKLLREFESAKGKGSPDFEDRPVRGAKSSKAAAHLTQQPFFFAHAANTRPRRGLVALGRAGRDAEPVSGVRKLLSDSESVPEEPVLPYSQSPLSTNAPHVSGRASPP